jgi:hypothetical protein
MFNDPLPVLEHLPNIPYNSTLIFRKRSVPLFGKEGLGEILLDKAPSIPLFKGGGERLLIFIYPLL